MFGIVVTCANIIQADLILSIDLDPVQNGIQNTRTVTTSTPFQVQLLLQITGTTSLDSFRTSVSFNNSGLTYMNGSTSPLANYSPQAGSLTLTGNILSPIEASSVVIGQGASAPLGPIVIGTFNFTTLNSVGAFQIAPFEGGLVGSFNNNLDPITPVIESGLVTTTAIPEPSTLFTSSLLIVGWSFGSRRRCRPVD